MKIPIVVRSLSLLLLILPLARAQGATLYVSAQGSDSNSGTSALPFRTITHAYSLANPGTTILVMSGVYTDHTSGWGLHLNASGTASSPIVLRSQVRGGAIIDGQNASDRNEAIYLDGSYNVVDGFEIRNGPNGGISIYGNNNQIINNEIHNNGNPASTSTNGKDGTYSDPNTSGNRYAGNYIHDNGRSGSNLDHGLYLCGKNEVVFNNVLVRNAATGLQVAGYNTVSNMRVYNNVIAWNGTAGIILWQSLSGISIENNIVYHNGHYGVGSFAATGSGVVVDHNLVFGNGSGSYDFIGGGSTYAYTLGTAISADPLFVNETSSGFDAHLAAGSPAIGAGLNLSSYLATDIIGTARPASGAWDLGAYKYGAAAADTTPPTVSLGAPANNATVSGTAVPVSANASDNVSVTSVQFKLDGTNFGSAFMTAPYAKTWDSTTVANGSHALTAVANDAAGNLSTATPVTITVSNTVAPLPTVTVSLTTTNASRVGLVSGVFTITRSGSTASALTVNYSLGGTAINGSDYNTLGTSSTISTGAASAVITLVPKPSTNYVGAKTAVLTLSTNSAYTLGSAKSALANIAGNSVPSTISKASGNVKITWSSIAGKVYDVVCKSNLSDTTWTNLSGLVTATSTTTSYTDTTASKPKTRYYTVYVTD